MSTVIDREDFDCYLVTVHGISSDGKWQETVRPVFEPHFNYLPVRYPDYRRLGPVKLLFEPWTLAAGITLLAGWAVYSAVSGWWVAAALSPVLLVSYAMSWKRRRGVLRRFWEDIDPALGPVQRPHFICHSFGTFLAGTSIEMRSDLYANAVVLTGCVLRRRYPWQTLWHAADPGRASKFSRVRNEVACRDGVSRLASFLHGLVPGLGHAGYAGFVASEMVHDVEAGLVECKACAVAEPAVPGTATTQPGTRGRVHNVIHKELGHSDLNLGTAHALRYWLPFLWGIGPPEFDELLWLCDSASKSEERHDDEHLAMLEYSLQIKEWRWAGGRTLPALLRAQIRYWRARHPSSTTALVDESDLVNTAVCTFWRVVARASDVSRPRPLSTARALYPLTAAIRAASAAFSSVQPLPPRGPGGSMASGDGT